MPPEATQAVRAGRRAARAAAALPRLVVEQVRPSVDAGRHPVKRLVGEDLAVEATVFKEGHDLVAARIRYRGPGDRAWRVAPMSYDLHFDRCRGTFPLDRVGRWAFTVEAWTDRFGTWRQDVAKKVDAGQDVTADLSDGAALVAEAAAHARGPAARTLRELAER
ncbi:MAG: maltotransferase domain-containing protein, partial [Gemmatimonadales bacterium]